MTPAEISAKIDENDGCYVVLAVSHVASLRVTCGTCGSEQKGRQAAGETMIGFMPAFLTYVEAQEFADKQGMGAQVMRMETDRTRRRE